MARRFKPGDRVWVKGHMADNGELLSLGGDDTPHWFMFVVSCEMFVPGIFTLKFADGRHLGLPITSRMMHFAGASRA